METRRYTVGGIVGIVEVEHRPEGSVTWTEAPCTRFESQGD